MDRGSLTFRWAALCAILGLGGRKVSISSQAIRQLAIVALIVTFHVDDPRKMRTTTSEVIEEVLRVFEEEEIKTSFPAQVVCLQGQEEEGG